MPRKSGVVVCLCTAMEELFKSVVADVGACAVLESLVCGKGVPKPPKQRARKASKNRSATTPVASVPVFNVRESVNRAVNACRTERRKRSVDDISATNDDELCKYARFTDDAALEPFAPFLHYVPRIVNVVTVRAPHTTYSGRTPSLLTLYFPLCLYAACGGRSNSWLGDKATTRPQLYRQSVHGSLLCAQALQCYTISLYAPESSRARFSHRQTGRHRYARRVLRIQFRSCTDHTDHTDHTAICLLTRQVPRARWPQGWPLLARSGR